MSEVAPGQLVQPVYGVKYPLAAFNFTLELIKAVNTAS